MRTSLIIFGVIFLVIGALLYFVPMQVIKANTTTAGEGNTDTRTSSASVVVPIEWAFASAVIGFVLLMLGLIISDPSAKNDLKRDSYEKVTESKEDIEVGDGNKRKIVRVRTEKQRAKSDDDE